MDINNLKTFEVIACRDCEFYKETPSGEAYCWHESSLSDFNDIDYNTGVIAKPKPTMTTERNRGDMEEYIKGHCGHDAKFFKKAHWFKILSRKLNL